MEARKIVFFLVILAISFVLISCEETSSTTKMNFVGEFCDNNEKIFIDYKLYFFLIFLLLDRDLRLDVGFKKCECCFSMQTNGKCERECTKTQCRNRCQKECAELAEKQREKNLKKKIREHSPEIEM